MVVPAVVVSNDFAFVMIVILCIAFECFFIGFLVGGGKRGKIFNKEFMEKHFGEEHSQAFGENISPGGYPDMGSGLYSQKLSYKDWYDFNNRQRAHYNYVEQIGVIIPFILVGGIVYPYITGGFGWLYFVGRIAFTYGYIAKGPQGRAIGATAMDVAILGTIVMSIMACVSVYNQ